MCSVERLVGAILIAAIILCLAVIFGQEVRQGIYFIIHTFNNTMGGNTSKEDAEVIENHNSGIELRFDHMALGGTVT